MLELCVVVNREFWWSNIYANTGLSVWYKALFNYYYHQQRSSDCWLLLSVY